MAKKYLDDTGLAHLWSKITDYVDTHGSSGGAVSGVKGNAETSYRTGQVNLTPANIGAVDKAGDTMTGDLYMDGTKGIRFHETSGYSPNWIYSSIYSNTNNMYIQSDGYVAMYVGKNDGTTDTAPAGRYYFQYDGATISGFLSAGSHIVCNNYLYIKTPKGGTTGGWDRHLDFTDQSDATFAKVGVYGGSDTLSYMYIGTNAYNGANFRIYPSGAVTIPNGVNYNCLNSGGSTRAMVAINSSNQYFFGYGAYTNSEGSTYFDGNIVNVRSKGNIIFTAGTSGTISGNKAYTNTSDIRLKKDIEYLSNKTDDILLNLKPFKFHWTDDEMDKDDHYGVSAQDLKAELGKQKIGGIVSETNGYYGVAYSELIPMLIHLCQTQQKEIDELKEKVK